MKVITTFLLTIFTAIGGYAQYIDLVNAPMNPIAFEYKKEHFNLKGDVYSYGYKVFSKEGKLIYENGISRGLHYLYKNGLPYADTEGRLYEFNSQGYLSKKTYASLGVQTQTYTYNAKGLISTVVNTKGYNATYEYDDNGRLIKSNIGGGIREFSYQKNGEQLIVTVKDLSKNPAVLTKNHYKNGVEIGRNDKLFDLKYDKKGNKSGYDNAIYYSDVENRNNEISVVYNKSSYSINPLSDCKFYINGQKADFLFKEMLSMQSKDLIIYNPFTEKYYIIPNAVDDTKSGQKQVFNKVFINSPYYLLNRKGSSLSLGYKGAVLTNTSNGMRDGALKVYNAPVYLAYDRTLNQTFYGDLDNANTSGYYPLQQIAGNDNLVYIKGGENQFTVVIEGKVNAKENPTSKLFKSTDGGSIITDDKNKPLYYLPGTATATLNKLYAGRKYNPATDKIQSANNVSANQNNTTAQSVNNNNTIAAQTTETRYYNGRYDYTNGLSSQEVVLSKIHSYIKIKSKAGVEFLKFEEKPGFLSGTWKIQSQQTAIVLSLDYIIGDKSLTINLKYITVGSKAIAKNDQDEGAKKMYNAAVQGFVTDLFKYLEIDNNAIQTNAQTKSITTNGKTNDAGSQSRLYNGKYTQQTALTAINKYIDNLKKLGTYSFVGGATKTYQIDGIWAQKISEQDKGTLNIRYIIGDNHLTIELISAILNKNGKAIMLHPQASDETIRKLYHNQVGMFVNGLFSYLGINDNASTTTKTSTVNSNITVQNNTKVANSTVNNVDPYSGLSAEAGAYMAAYRMNLNGLKSYLENQLKSWEQKG